LFAANDDKAHNSLYIIVWLLYQKKDPEEKWKEYIDVLPTNFDDFVPFWGEDEWSILEDTSTGKRL